MIQRIRVCGDFAGFRRGETGPIAMISGHVLSEFRIDADGPEILAGVDDCILLAEKKKRETGVLPGTVQMGIGVGDNGKQTMIGVEIR